MKKFFLFLFFVSSLFAQVEYSRKGAGTGLLPKFYIDLATYASQDSEKSKMDVFIKIPYSNIQFLKTATSYAAKYSVTISLYDNDEVLKLEKLWTKIA